MCYDKLMKEKNQNEICQIILNEAKKAYHSGEVPIGACVVKNGKVISKAHNNREKKQNAINHAEIIAISRACKKLNSWRLDDCDIYVTLEPCPMCAGAIANARIRNLFYLCKDKTSNDNLCQKILSSKRLNHNSEMIFLKEYEENASKLLSDFFKDKRENAKK